MQNYKCEQILLIDNYDSFSYNLYQMIGAINPNIQVIRNDELSVEEIKALKPSHIIISPGPGKPKDTGICIELIQKLYKEIPILGVCLGHQSIFEAFGGTVSYAKKLMHGKQSEIEKMNNSKLFENMPQNFSVARYHSLAGLEETLPECLKITALTKDNEIMAIEHKECNVFGVQFHPESILTHQGKTIIKNFIQIEKE